MRALGSLISVLTLLAACTENDPTNRSVQAISVIAFHGAHKVVRHSDVRLAARTKAAFERARKMGDRTYSAFYVRADGRGWAFTTGHYTEQDARRMAKIDCQLETGGPCVLYATFVPQVEPTRHTIPKHHEETVVNEIRDTKRGNYLTIANNPAGHTGIGFNSTSQAISKSSAIKACADLAQTDLKNEEARFTVAYEAAGLLECKVLSVYR